MDTQPRSRSTRDAGEIGGGFAYLGFVDLSVVFIRDGKLDMKRGFDVGAGPSAGVERVMDELWNLGQDGLLDEELVRRATWMADWEALLLSDAPRAGWPRWEASGVLVARCEPEELDRVIAATEALAPEAAAMGAAAAWESFTAFLRACRSDGGSVALWCDLEG